MLIAFWHRPVLIVCNLSAHSKASGRVPFFCADSYSPIRGKKIEGARIFFVLRSCLYRRGERMDDIYKRNVENIYRICFMYLKNPADAEDAVQSTFLKLLKSDIAFADTEHEKAWLIVTARNHCKDVLKSWWRTRKAELPNLPEAGMDDSFGHSGEVLERLLSLPDKYKIVLYLYYFEEYSVKEIAGMLKRKESTIQTQLAKGRKLMKVSLGGYYGNESY
ncbi:RNA polymerase sigma factor [Paenibacillus protaetiae]|nr:sigma-70 family RNA polymerase sigma factor [Paenibacillus protaetiae]